MRTSDEIDTIPEGAALDAEVVASLRARKSCVSFLVDGEFSPSTRRADALYAAVRAGIGPGLHRRMSEGTQPAAEIARGILRLDLPFDVSPLPVAESNGASS